MDLKMFTGNKGKMALLLKEVEGKYLRKQGGLGSQLKDGRAFHPIDCTSVSDL